MKPDWYYKAIEAAQNIQSEPRPFYPTRKSDTLIELARQKLSELLNDDIRSEELQTPNIQFWSFKDKYLRLYVDYETGQWHILRFCLHCKMSKWLRISAAPRAKDELPIPTLQSIGEGLLETFGCSNCLKVNVGEPWWPDQK